MLDLDDAREYRNFLGRLGRLKWPQPALKALAGVNRAVRQGELSVILVAEYREPVHSRTLGNALQFLATAGLITRHQRGPRLVMWEITSSGRDVIEALETIKRAAEQWRNAHPESGQHHEEPHEPD